MFEYGVIMFTNTLVDPARVVTAGGCDLGNYRLGLVRDESERWGRIITALDAGWTILVAPVDGSDAFDLSVTSDSEFDVYPVVSEGV
ncbi:hypothetical protein CH295_25695 [Rhodococcus sp. 14-2483-1-2]|nr:hypothetical protein CH295_25695 [Rhodococcus sp. 14-2483-1-2]